MCGSVTKRAAVSVVVPAYNVENYIEQCALSVLNQSYLCCELIIVDDGSTDSTTQILDKLREKNDHVRVIHKENAGVSAARNTGIETAKGDYIVFVDGDDYLAPNFIEYMVSMAQDTGAEFCLSKSCFTRKNEGQTEKERLDVLTPAEATALLLSPTVIVGCWNKMFSRQLLIDKKIHFATDLFYGEGLHFITTVAQRANCVAVGNQKAYYYRRNNALSATTKFRIESVYNGEKSINQIENELTVSGDDVNDMLLLHRSMYNIGAITKLINNNVKKQYLSDYKRWLKFNRRNIVGILCSKRISMYRKCLLLGGCVSPALMARLDVWRRKKISVDSVTGR